MRRRRRASVVYLAMLGDLRTAFERGDEALPFEKKFSDWAYEHNTATEKVKRYQLKVRMELAREAIPVVPIFGQSERQRLLFVGLKVCSRDEAGWAEVQADGIRDVTALKGRAVNMIIRQTARIDSGMLPPHRRRQHKRLIGRQAEQWVKLLGELAQSGQRNQES